MSTICDIDDSNLVYHEAAGHDFVVLLQQLAIEHGRIKLENTALLAKIGQPCNEHRRKTRFDSDTTETSTNSVNEPAEEAPIRDLQFVSVEQTASTSQQSSKPLRIASGLPQSSVSFMSSIAGSSQNMDLHNLWTQSIERLEGLNRTVTRSLSFKPERTAARGGDSLREEASCMQMFIVGPSYVKRMLWDLVSIIVLSFDIVMVPMVAFDIPETPGLKNSSLGCTIFWTLDMIASFLTGFHIEGAIEMRPRKVFKHYLKGWFPFDFVVVLVDWVLFSLTSDLVEVAGLFRVSKVLRLGRIFRALRLLRLIRVLKMPSILDEVADNISTDGLIISFRVIRSLITIGVASHFLACGWYAVGRATTPSWISELDHDGRDLAFRYASALHWALTQFIPASVEIYPRNLPERVYSISILFLALVVFSSFVSSITNAMSHLQQINEASSRQRSNLRRYINENKLSLELGNRIIAYARHLNVRTIIRVHESEIDVFKVLPEALRLQLHWEVYVPILAMHPFFFHFAELFEPVVLELCHNAMSEKSLMTSQELFSQDDEAKAMYFALSGSLDYYRGHTDIRDAVVSQDEWCSEIALWLIWVYEGQLAALSNAEFIALDAKDFRKNVGRSPSLFAVCQAYAISFQKCVTELNEDTPLDIFYDHSCVLELSQKAFDTAGVSLGTSYGYAGGTSWVQSLIRTFTRSSQIDIKSNPSRRF